MHCENYIKMADNSIARELLEQIDTLQHTKVARHIPHSAEISLKYFENSGLSCEYFLDLDDMFYKKQMKIVEILYPESRPCI